MTVPLMPVVMPHLDVYEKLRRGKWFGRLAPAHAEALFTAGQIRTFKSGENLYPEADTAAGVFALIDGSIHLDRIDMEGQRFLLHVATPGYWFGEFATASGRHTIVNATAFGAVRTWHVPLISAMRLMAQMPVVLAAFHQMTAARYRSLIRLVCALRRPSVLAQIAGRLVLLDRSCKDSDSGVEISVIEMTQNDLADMTGHVRQTVNAVVRRLEQEGLIRIQNRKIAILNPARLEQHTMS